MVMLTGVCLCVIPPFVINCTPRNQRLLERSAPTWSQFAISEASEMFQQGVNPTLGWYVTTPDPSSPHGQRIEAAGLIYKTEGAAKLALTQSSWMVRIPRPLPPID
jgi:hypothetical protein